MHFASFDAGDDYDEMRMKVINGSWLFRAPDLNLSFELPPKHHIDQFLGNQTRSVKEIITRNDQLMN